MLRDLDTLAGVDAWHMWRSGGCMRGVALRIQPVDGRPWNTFTIRESRANGCKTELEKRLYAIAHRDGGWLMPAITAQAYTDKTTGAPLRVAVCKTEPLYGFVADNMPEPKTFGDMSAPVWRKRVYDGNTLLAVKWSTLINAGVAVRVWPANTTENASCQSSAQQRGTDNAARLPDKSDGQLMFPWDESPEGR
jgi:hypothetical protein